MNAHEVVVCGRGYVVRAGSLSVEVDERFDAATLRRPLAVLSSC